jgi:hypothetical protein
VCSVTSYPTLEGGDAIRDDNPRAPYYFMQMLPPHALIHVVTLTSRRILDQGKDVTTDRDIPKNSRIFAAFVTYGTSSRKLSLIFRALGGRLTCLFLHDTVVLSLLASP